MPLLLREKTLSAREFRVQAMVKEQAKVLVRSWFRALSDWIVVMFSVIKVEFYFMAWLIAEVILKIRIDFMFLFQVL